METWGYLLTQPKPSAIEQARELGYIKYTAPGPATATFQHDPTTKETRTIITSESRSLILSSGTTGFRTWEAALHLGTYLSTSPEAAETYIRGKRVLELGAGTGFLSLFCAKYLQPRGVVATDRETALVERIEDCTGRNCIRGGHGDGGLETGMWEWGSERGLQVSGGENESEREFDIALGADLVSMSIHSILCVDVLMDKDLRQRPHPPPPVNPKHPLHQTQAPTLSHLCYTAQSGDVSGVSGCMSYVSPSLLLYLHFHVGDADDAIEENKLTVERLPFESPGEDRQRGFFHSTGIPIATFVVTK